MPMRAPSACRQIVLSARLFALISLVPVLSRAHSDSANPDIVESLTCTSKNLFAIDASLHSLVLRVLSKDPKQGMEAARFLAMNQANPIRLAVAYEQRDEFPQFLHMSPYKKGDSQAWAYYSLADSKIGINHIVLHQGLDNEMTVIQDPRRLERLIKTIAGSVIHEVSHARDAAERGGKLNSLETEIIAFYREVFYELDTLEEEGLSPILIKTARVLERREDIAKKVRAFESRRRKLKRRLPRPPELVEAVDAYNKDINSMPQFVANQVDRLLSFQRGNKAFEDSIANDYQDRSLICTIAGLQRERDDLLASRDELAEIGKKIRSICERLKTSECIVKVEDSDKSVARAQRRVDELMASEPRGQLCAYYGRLLNDFRQEAEVRRARSRPLFDRLTKQL